MFLLIFILFWGCFFQTIQTAPCEKSFTTSFVTLGSRPIPGVLRGIVVSLIILNYDDNRRRKEKKKKKRFSKNIFRSILKKSCFISIIFYK